MITASRPTVALAFLLCAVGVVAFREVDMIDEAPLCGGCSDPNTHATKVGWSGVSSKRGSTLCAALTGTAFESCFGDPEVKVILTVTCVEKHVDGHRKFYIYWWVKGYTPCSHEITPEEWKGKYGEGVDDRIVGNEWMLGWVNGPTMDDCLTAEGNFKVVLWYGFHENLWGNNLSDNYLNKAFRDTLSIGFTENGRHLYLMGSVIENTVEPQAQVTLAWKEEDRPYPTGKVAEFTKIE